MAEYRAFFLDQDGHVTRREDFESDSDASALIHAKQWVDGKDIEVWQLARVVGKIKRREDT